MASPGTQRGTGEFHWCVGSCFLRELKGLVVARVLARAVSLRAITEPLWFVAALVPLVMSQIVRLEQSDPAAWIGANGRI
jgi:hypothetical protein